ncbi:hypothetical protein [Georgenia faecalis]|uniref:Uncharacterized protein n=1 Tax=Georgenia faecalis TaxID=2483799 RepID=A0ABV9DAX1_9MICO|nr:hypothetical protein [Georgenia faecalis]
MSEPLPSQATADHARALAEEAKRAVLGTEADADAAADTDVEDDTAVTVDPHPTREGGGEADLSAPGAPMP